MSTDTTTMTTEAKHRALSLRILRLVDEGKTVHEAMEFVLGVGTFDRVAGDLYEAFRADDVAQRYAFRLNNHVD